jgi:hypothetical protein
MALQASMAFFGRVTINTTTTNSFTFHTNPLHRRLSVGNHLARASLFFVDLRARYSSSAHLLFGAHCPTGFS